MVHSNVFYFSIFFYILVCLFTTEKSIKRHRSLISIIFLEKKTDFFLTAVEAIFLKLVTNVELSKK